MLGIVVSRADSASVAIGEQLRDLAEWEQTVDERRPAGEGRTVYRTEGATIREFETRHLDLVAPAAAFDDPSLLVFASRHAGDTGPLLTAHHTGNVGSADHGGEANELARACPNAHARVIAALVEHAPEDYAVGMECTHHGPTDVGAPSMFVEVGSDEAQWEDDRAVRAVAKAILSIRGVAPDREFEASGEVGSGTATPPQAKEDRYRRHLVGLGGGHYVPRFERVVRETDWAIGHILADWGFEAIADFDDPEATRRAVVDQAFDQSRAVYALVDGDRPDLESLVSELGYRAVSETWVRETDGVALSVVERLEDALTTVDDGLRFGAVAETIEPPAIDEIEVTTFGDALEEAFGLDRKATRAAVASHALAFETIEGGTRPDGRVALRETSARGLIGDEIIAILGQRYDSVRRIDGEETAGDTSEHDPITVTETAFDPDLARTLDVPEGPKFGRLADGEAVEVDGERIPPETVQRERSQRLWL